jgi:hypothetical protein
LLFFIGGGYGQVVKRFLKGYQFFFDTAETEDQLGFAGDGSSVVLELTFGALNGHSLLAEEVVNLPEGVDVFGTVETWPPFDTPDGLGFTESFLPKA